MGDQNDNCPSGVVVDDVVGHPTEFDFYLQSHSVSGGTARSAHYSVLHDENNFTQDSLQILTFALCHSNARTTRSISIPAPLHYANIVSWRAKIHFDPSVNYNSMDAEATASEGDSLTEENNYPTTGRNSSALERFRSLYQPLHESMRYKMFFV
ncbi:Piwi-domain-containing protein [Ceratobasidium sp. AG-I]|nr:Piwi-domain-containing protein [Ceratobasidium sp. AG-I]